MWEAAGVHRRVRLAAVGPATAEALAAAAWGGPSTVATVPRAEGLLAEFPAGRAHILLAQADRLARRQLADGLAAAGHDVESVIAYRTVVRRPTVAEVAELATVEAVVLASGTAAQGYADALGVATGAVVVAVGPTTAEAARDYGLSVNHVAASPDTESLVQLLESGRRRLCERQRRPVLPLCSHSRPAGVCVSDNVGRLGGYVLTQSAPVACPPWLRRSRSPGPGACAVPPCCATSSPTAVRTSDLIAPLFVREDVSEPQPILSLPGVVQHSRESLRKEVVELAQLGVRAVVLFGVPAAKDATGSGAYDPEGIVQVALDDLRSEVGDDIVLIADLCIDEYTDHGHCGVLDGRGEVDNDATLRSTPVPPSPRPGRGRTWSPRAG